MNRNKLRQSLSLIDFRLLGVLLLMGILPTLYRTVRINFLGDIPADWGFNIASQLAWLGVAYEVVHEALMLPMFYLIGRFVDDKPRFGQAVSNGVVLIGVLYGLLSAITIGLAKPMIVFMAQRTDLVEATVTYIRLEAVGLALASFARFFTLILIVLKRDSRLLVLLVAQVFLSIVFDAVFVSALPFFLRVGINGVAYTNIVVNAVLIAISVVMVSRSNVTLFGRQFRLDWNWLCDWFNVGGLSGLESFVRNAAFILMVLRLVNEVQQQGVFWVTNGFIWGWLLFPILALGELIKRDTAADEAAVQTHVPAYMFLTAVVVGAWFVTIPFWKGFIATVMGVPDAGAVYQIALVSLVFYVTFAFNNVADAVFYGRGRTDLMLYQSLIVNTVFYGGAFVLYVTRVFEPTLIRIAIMFGIGIAFDSVITFVMFIRFRRAVVQAM